MGVHRFYLGDKWQGLLIISLTAIFLIWWGLDYLGWLSAIKSPHLGVIRVGFVVLYLFELARVKSRTDFVNARAIARLKPEYQI